MLISWLQRLAFLEFFLGILVAVLIPKSTVVTLAIMAAVALVVLVFSQVPMRQLFALDSVVLWVFGLAVWAGLSATWSPVPVETLTAAAFLPLLCWAIAAIASSSRYAPSSLASNSRWGFTAGVVCGVLVLGLDLASGQGLSRSFFTAFPELSETPTRHVVFVDGVAVDVSEATANRRAIVIALLTIPLLYQLAQTEASWRRSALAAASATGYAVMLSLTESLSAQLGLLAGGLTWWAARHWPRMAARSLATAWIGACLVFLPASLMLKSQNMHQSAYLPPSARERVVIWNDTAELTLSNPWTGIGANASRAVSKAELAKTQPAQPPSPQPPYHPHSAYLQIWYELGVPGLALFLALGLSVIWRITRLNSEIRPFALGQFASVAVIMATSFSLWQYWFLSAVALGVVGLLLIDIVAERARTERPPENLDLR